ncbi:MAG: hypothetical protein P8Z78_06975 [Gammaproteobacteria bacterium]
MDDDDGIASIPAISSAVPGILRGTGRQRSRPAPAPRHPAAFNMQAQEATRRQSVAARAAVEGCRGRPAEQKENKREIKQNLEVLFRCGWNALVAERGSAEGT